MRQETAQSGRFYARLLCICLALFIGLLPLVSHVGPATAADTLGLRVEVLPNAGSTDEEPYAQNRRLWFIASDSKPTTRTIRVTSTVENAQLITLSISAAKRVGEGTELDSSRESQLQPWISFSNNSFQLPARGQIEVKVTVTPPADLMDYSQDAFLIVNSAGTRAPELDQNAMQAVMASQLQFATPLFFGVGKLENLVSIQIKDVETYIDENGKYAEIEILNNGVSPVEITGDIQFTNLDFETRAMGQLDFSLAPLKPGESDFGTVRLPDVMVAGKYKMFVQAYVGSYGEALIITKDLTFDVKRPSPLPRLIIFGASILVLVMLIVYRRRIQASSDDTLNTQWVNKVKFAVKLPKIPAVKLPKIPAVKLPKIKAIKVKATKAPKPAKIGREPKDVAKRERVPLITIQRRTTSTPYVKPVHEASEALIEARKRVADLMESLSEKR